MQDKFTFILFFIYYFFLFQKVGVGKLIFLVLYLPKIRIQWPAEESYLKTTW